MSIVIIGLLTSHDSWDIIGWCHNVKLKDICHMYKFFAAYNIYSNTPFVRLSIAGRKGHNNKRGHSKMGTYKT